MIFRYTNDKSLGLEIAGAWEEVDFTMDSLRDRFVSSGREVETLKAKLKLILKRKFEDCPPNWGGHSLDFLVEKTLQFFYPKKDPRRESSEELKPEELGFVSVRRIIPQSDLQLWKKALDGNAHEMRLLECFCDSKKLDIDIWKESNTKLILLDFVKLLKRNKLTISDLKRKASDSTDIKKLEDRLGGEIFGQNFNPRKRNKRGGYTASSDFEIYFELFSKVLRLLKGGQDRINVEAEIQVQCHQGLSSSEDMSTSASPTLIETEDAEAPVEIVPTPTQVFANLQSYLDQVI